MTASRKTILVVEDNLIAARVAKTLFEFLGCEVHHVEDGSEAVVNGYVKAPINGAGFDLLIATWSSKVDRRASMRA